MTSSDSHSTLRNGQFEVGKSIGQGAVGVVYAGRQFMPDRPVAIKVLRDDFAMDENARRRFIEEANTCARLSATIPHPGIVSVIAVVDDLFPAMDMGDGQIATRPAIVMELLVGETIKQRLVTYHKRGETMSPDEAVRIMSGVLEALDYVHTRSIESVTHRDIKPANIFLCKTHSPEERVVVTDFGIARVEGAASLTKTGTAVGTPEYMSPEQIKGERGDARSDLYSCGVMFHEMLAGTPPFTGDSSHAVMFAHVEKVPPELPASVPAYLHTVVQKALAKDPDDRFLTAREFSQALASRDMVAPLKKKKKAKASGQQGGKPMGAIFGGAALAAVLLVAVGLGSRVSVTNIQHIEPILVPPAPPSTKDLIVTVKEPGKPGKRSVVEEVRHQWWRESGRRIVGSQVKEPMIPPTVQEASVTYETTKQPDDIRRVTSRLNPGERNRTRAGKPGKVKISDVRVLQGNIVIGTPKTVREVIEQPVAALYEVGAARKARPVSPTPVIRHYDRPSRPSTRPQRPSRPRPSVKKNIDLLGN